MAAATGPARVYILQPVLETLRGRAAIGYRLRSPLRADAHRLVTKHIGRCCVFCGRATLDNRLGVWVGRHRAYRMGTVFVAGGFCLTNECRSSVGRFVVQILRRLSDPALPPPPPKDDPCS